MSLNRYNAARDANETEIIKALAACGVQSWRISGDGIPDLLCAKDGAFFMIEVKTASGKLTRQQEAFFALCHTLGDLPAFVVRSVDDIPRILDKCAS